MRVVVRQGFYCNNNLNWNSHMNKVTNKIPKTVGILNKLRPLQALPSALQLQLMTSSASMVHFPRNGRNHVLMFLHFSSIISRLYVRICRVRSVRCLPLQHLHVQCQVRVCWGERFQWRRVLLLLFRYVSYLAAFNEVLSF